MVNRSPDAELGWFTVDAITTLFNGHLQLADVTEQLTVSGDHKDMVGLQLVEEIALDDRGFVAPTGPTMVAAPAAPTPGPEPHATVSDRAESERATPPITLDRERDLATEVAVAAEIATGMEATAVGGPQVPVGVNLALVAELLEDLDVGDAPQVTPASSLATPGSDPDAAPVVPDGARPLYGNELPETPSYKNPVVVPEGTLLPRRSRAA